MKTTITTLVLSMLLFASCSGDDDAQPTGPDIVVTTDGYLCTGTSSTPYYFVFIGRAETLWRYTVEHADSKYKVSFKNASSGATRIELKTPYISNGVPYKYLGIYKAGNPSITSFPNHEYQFQIYSEPVPETEFEIVRDPLDINRFTIESKLYPGQFLNTGKWKGHLGSDESSLVFEEGELYFYFK